MPVRGDQSPRMPGGLRLELADPLRADLLEAVDAVGGGSFGDGREPRQLIVGQGDDELARVA